MRALGIIPARGGSKGIPGKNLVPLCGKPLIHYTIEAALAAASLSAVAVNSDDAAILAEAGRFPGVLAQARPPELATDAAPVGPVAAHALAAAEQASGQRFDVLVLLQPTAPLREPRHIDEALLLLEATGAASVISVYEVSDAHPARMYKLRDGLLDPLMPELEQGRRQDMPRVYHRNGSIYAVRREAFERGGSLMAKPAAGYVMDASYLANIDEPRDLVIAEALLRQLRGLR